MAINGKSGSVNCLQENAENSKTKLGSDQKNRKELSQNESEYKNSISALIHVISKDPVRVQAE